MIFSKENAGKWVASKGGEIVATDKDLEALMQKIEARKDASEIVYDLVPLSANIGSQANLWSQQSVTF